MLICLILSAVTPDSSCIKGTIRLKKAGLLDAKKLAETSWEEVYPYVKSCGIGKPTAKHIVVLASQLMERHGGRVPCTLAKLKALKGIADKGAAILINEIFGLVELLLNMLRTSHLPCTSSTG